MRWSTWSAEGLMPLCASPHCPIHPWGRGGCAASAELVGAPDYFKRHGRPAHPRDLLRHACLCYAYLPRRTSGGSSKGRRGGTGRRGAAARQQCRCSCASAPCRSRACRVQPDFVVGEAIEDGRLEVVMPDWSPPPIALHLVMPPGGPRPARVEVLAAFLSERLGA